MSDLTVKADPALIKTVQSYIGLVRAKLRDYPELNRLLEGHETSDRQIAASLMLAVDDYNTTPPLIDPVTLQTYPSVELLVTGAIIDVLESVGLLQMRNYLTTSDGASGSVSDKAPMLMQWAGLFRSRYEQKKFRLKQALNLQGAMGNQSGVSSEYLAINGYFNDQESA
ncbi:MAG: hypothetical protein ACOYOB_19975 [Myxococcota bacterium]